MTLVDNDEVEEVRGELLEDVLGFFSTRDCLVESQVDFEGLVDLAVRDLSHGPGKGLKVVRLGLVDQDVAVGEE